MFKESETERLERGVSEPEAKTAIKMLSSAKAAPGRMITVFSFMFQDALILFLTSL